MNNFKKFIPYILGAILLVFIYFRGRADGEIREAIKRDKEIINNLKEQVKAQLDTIKVFKDSVNKVKSKVIVVDKHTTPIINSNLDSLRATLDSNQKRQLNLIVTSFEDRLKSRDDVITIQDSTIARFDRIVIKQAETMDSLTKAWNRALNARQSTLSKILDYGSKAALLILLFRGN